MAEGAAQRILIVDDDAELTNMLSLYLVGEGFIVDAVSDGEDGISAAMKGYHAIILDVMLPRISGINVLRRIREVSDVPIIMLTAKGDNLERAMGLELGADDYIAKPYFPRELLARLKAVLRRRGVPTNDRDNAFQCGSISIDWKARKADLNGRELDLTFSELTLLRMLLESSGAVVSKEDLSLHVVGRPWRAFDRSVDVHISNLRQKISGAPDLVIETVRKAGYRLVVR